MASTVLALLDEPDYSLKEYALQTLDNQVNDIWPEIADHIPLIEMLYEDEDFPAKELAALVVSKVYFNLGDLSTALQYALSANKHLDLTQKSEFVDSIISHGIKTYVDLRQEEVDNKTRNVDLDPKLTAVVESMLLRCFESNHYELALGLAMEARRIDLMRQFLEKAHSPKTLSFVIDSSITLLRNRDFRSEILRLVDEVINAALKSEEDFAVYYALSVKVAIQLSDSEMAHKLLLNCKPEALALQVAFDFVSSASQELRDKTAKLFGSELNPHHRRIVEVLSGVLSCDLNVTFLKQNNHTDLNILEKTKQSLDSRNSMFHSALSFQNALLHLGTTHDNFFRSNIDWLGKASHWTKFVATAALGVIHQGNLTQGFRILQPYLSKTDKASAHVRGGALYGLGLVFAGFGKEVVEFLHDKVYLSSGIEYDESDETVVHGALLGMALAGMRSQNEALYSKLRDELYVDSAVAGEAVGIAMGMIMLGSKNAVAEEEMLQYARDTQHEKIIRSLAVGIALLNYGKEEAADDIIDVLLSEHEPLLRYGGCFTLALAYAGTSDNRATKRLLHTAVSDSNDDVRRSAVMALGFIYLRNPLALPRMVELLSESHNPHVRYGTALALGIACAGTGLVAAVDVLEPMLKDPVDFVRQGAMISLAMILVQHTEQSHPRVKSVREHFANIVKTKNEDAMVKFGAALAQGIIDAGGCNTTISLDHRQTGNLNMRAIAGLTVFLQYWFWFPYTHFISLAFTPTTVCCVDEELRVPQMTLECVGAPAKRFGYPKPLEECSAKTPNQVFTAVLSTTLKEKKKKSTSRKEKEKEEKAKEQKAKDEAESEIERLEQEKLDNLDDFEIANLSRVVPWQRKYVKFYPQSEYELIDSKREARGVVVVHRKDGKTNLDPKDEDLFIITQAQKFNPDLDIKEAPLPEPFELVPNPVPDV